MPASLRVIQGPQVGKVITIEDGQSVIVGRSKTADVTIGDPLLSRQHMRLGLRGIELVVEDLKSSNGTFVNGSQIEEAVVRVGDRVRIGATTLEVFGPATPEPSGVFADERPGKLRFCSRCYRAFSAAAIFAGELDLTEGKFVCPECLEGRPFNADMIEGFKLLDKIAQGKLGAVYKARHVALDKFVAIKLVTPERAVDRKVLKRFMREAKIGGMLSHPNIVETYDAAEQNGVFYITMEYVDGETLEERLRDKGPLLIPEAVRVARAVAAGLRYAHERQIVHRNVRPANIMLGKAGEVKLTDFAMAKSLEDEGGSAITTPGEGTGTLYYLPPEQVTNALHADARSDIYSLGATLYHMIGGQPPFMAPTIGMSMRKVVSGELQPLPELAPSVLPGIWAAIQKAMAKAPEARHPTVQAFADDLATSLAPPS